MVSWERAVVNVSAGSKPKEAYEAVGRWKAMTEGLDGLKGAIKHLSDLSEHDGSGHSWTGKAGDAFRGYLTAMQQNIEDLQGVASTVQGALNLSADDLAAAVGKIPVPLYLSFWAQARMLPGGQHVGDEVFNSKNADAFATTLKKDKHGNAYYDDGGFKQRALDNIDSWGEKSYEDSTGTMSGRGKAGQAGARQNAGNTYSNNPKVPHAVTTDDVQKKAIDTWYRENTGVAQKAYHTLTSNMSAPANTLATAFGGLPDRYSMFDRRADEHDFDRDAGSPAGAGGTPGLGTGAPSIDGPTRSGTFDPPTSGTFGTDPTSYTSDPGYRSDGGYSSGLAGAGAPSGVGGGYGTGAGGSSDGAVPGQVSAGSSSAGPARSPIGPITSPEQYLAEQRAAAGRGAMPPGMMGGGHGASGAGSKNGEEHQTWLAEEDDPWGADPDSAPSVLS
ncbi:MAG: hypothetical protein WCA46_01890 [Actinocatenispora sp.]